MRLIDLKPFADLSDRISVKVSLCKCQGSGSKEGFAEKISIGDLGYACWNKLKHKNFRLNEINLVFVKIGDNDLLFVAAVKITDEVAEGACGYTDVTADLGLDPFARKLEITDTAPNKTKLGCWVFKSSRLLDLNVFRYDSTAEWSRLEWRGYDKIKLSFGELFDIIESGRYPAYRTHLEDICGVYLLTDTLTGLKYVGSAYGENGLAQRWKCYLETCHGGNKMLLALFNEKGPQYFKDNFTFELLYHYPLGTAKERVIARESAFKMILGTKTGGLNAN